MYVSLSKSVGCGYRGDNYYRHRVRENKKPANTLAALAVMVSNRYRGQGMSAKILEAIKSLAKENNLQSVVVPVRPTLKSHYPLSLFNDYVNWKRPNESPFDPWLRVHGKMGAYVSGTIPNALTVEGSVMDWKEWTEMRFPDSGEYIVEGSIKPVVIDRTDDKNL